LVGPPKGSPSVLRRPQQAQASSSSRPRRARFCPTRPSASETPCPSRSHSPAGRNRDPRGLVQRGRAKKNGHVFAPGLLAAHDSAAPERGKWPVVQVGENTTTHQPTMVCPADGPADRALAAPNPGPPSRKPTPARLIHSPASMPLFPQAAGGPYAPVVCGKAARPSSLDTGLGGNREGSRRHGATLAGRPRQSLHATIEWARVWLRAMPLTERSRSCSSPRNGESGGRHLPARPLTRWAAYTCAKVPVFFSAFGAGERSSGSVRQAPGRRGRLARLPRRRFRAPGTSFPRLEALPAEGWAALIGAHGSGPLPSRSARFRARAPPPPPPPPPPAPPPPVWAESWGGLKTSRTRSPHLRKELGQMTPPPVGDPWALNRIVPTRGLGPGPGSLDAPVRACPPPGPPGARTHRPSSR